LSERFIVIECRDRVVRQAMVQDIAAIPKLKRIQAAAEKLLTLVANKGEPMDHPDNQKLLEAGDIISVNEGNLWALMAELRSSAT